MLDGMILLIAGALLVYALGRSFIDYFFKRQEEIINRMTTKGDV
jgi:hypothetical protein